MRAGLTIASSRILSAFLAWRTHLLPSALPSFTKQLIFDTSHPGGSLQCPSDSLAYDGIRRSARGSATLRILFASTCGCLPSGFWRQN
ncbi:hypothetical protein K438DRAFT_1147873 [Mycena galopus ATCC 62051]|nr:hypothetical protein K438DRAFT_1147873 [Mycena galopus ATCC 62051]